LAIWVVLSAVLLARRWTRAGWTADTAGLLRFQLLIAAMIVFVLPMLQVKPWGLPIRGYGLMMLLGVVTGTAAASYRAAQVEIDPERIYGLLLWLLVAGIGGARLFYVIEYFDAFRRDAQGQLHSVGTTLLEIVRFTEGGLVVYGALLGATVAFWLYARRHRLSLTRLADVVAPSLMLGLAFGRLGCLLNGCCFGDVCQDGPLCITFPRYSAPERQTLSPPYLQQLSEGRLHGIRIAARAESGQSAVVEVAPGSPALTAGLATGTVVRAINAHPVRDVAEAQAALRSAGPEVTLIDEQQHAYHWSIGGLPERSLPVHPTQLYSALNALLIFCVAWCYFPLRRYDGAVLGIVMTLYPMTRFLLEVVRADEGGQFGTPLTISQWVSLLILAAMVPYWCYLRAGRAKALSEG
jgi:phosphatidylglycerol:prolipoprotein diacylglycerol transferase